MNRLIMFVGCALCFAGPAYAQQCLHASNESPEQKVRRQQAVLAARLVNTLQANNPNTEQRFLHHEELAAAFYPLKDEESIKPFNPSPGQEVMPGWELKLDVSANGYWFMVKDKMDPCGFAYISNTMGVIYTAEPMR